MLGDIAGILEELEYSRHLVAVLVDLRSDTVRQSARNILVESAAGDVADGFHGDLGDHVQNGLNVDSGRLEECVAEGGTQLRIEGLEVLLVDVEHFSYQGESVGVNAAGGNAHNSVAGLDSGSVQYLGLVNDTGAVSCDVVFVLSHHAGVLCGFAADQGAACHYAAVCNSLDDLRNLLRNDLADSDVVQEEQRLCAAADDIVHTHCDSVDTDGVVLVHQHCELELCTYAVGAAYEHRFLHAGEVRHEQTAESADTGNAPGGVCPCDMFLHKAN